MDLEKKEQELRNAIREFEKDAGGKMWIRYETSKLETLNGLLEQSLPVYWTHNGLVWTNLSWDCFLDTFPSVKGWFHQLKEKNKRWFPELKSEEYLRKEFEKIGVENADITISEIYGGFPDRKLLEKVFGVKPLTLMIDQPGGAINIKKSKFFKNLFEVTNKNNASLFIENVAYTKNPDDPQQILAVKVNS